MKQPGALTTVRSLDVYFESSGRFRVGEGHTGRVAAAGVERISEALGRRVVIGGFTGVSIPGRDRTIPSDYDIPGVVGRHTVLFTRRTPVIDGSALNGSSVVEKDNDLVTGSKTVISVTDIAQIDADVFAHEGLHSFLVDHCPNSDPNCLMSDSIDLAKRTPEASESLLVCCSGCRVAIAAIGQRLPRN